MLPAYSTDCYSELLSLNYASSIEIRDNLNKEPFCIKCFYTFKDKYLLTHKDKYDIYPNKLGYYPNGYFPYGDLSYAELGIVTKKYEGTIGLSLHKNSFKEDKIYNSNTCKKWFESI
jgi:hypothetical protein